MPLRYVRPLEPAERASLWQQTRTSADVRLVHRGHAMLLSAEGWPVPRIAALLQVDQSTVHRWFALFKARGVVGLAIPWGRGRPPRGDEAYETVRHQPRWYGWEPSLWTCPLLTDYLAQQTDVRLSAERVHVLWHQHGLWLKQPIVVVHSPDPQGLPKRCGPRWACLGSWRRRHELHADAVWGGERRHGVHVALTGQTHVALSAHKRSADLQHFVDHDIIPAYPRAECIFLIVDGARTYDSQSTRAWRAQRPQIVLVPLPSYAPELNLQE